jgi:chaperonin GroES
MGSPSAGDSQFAPANALMPQQQGDMGKLPFAPDAGGLPPQMPASVLLPPPPPRPPEMDLLEHLARMPNVAARMSDSEDGADELIPQHELDKLSRQVDDGYVLDKASRADWDEQAGHAMEVAMQRREGKSYPFPNAANVQYPLITIAAEQFNARAYPAICTGPNVVRARISGADPQGQKAARSTRIQQFLSHQIIDGMQGRWEHDMDVLLYQLPIIGSAIKKTYWDTALDTPITEMISSFDFYVNSNTRNLRYCPRMTHRFSLYPYEVEERMRDGRFLDLDLDAIGDSSDDQSPIWFIEQHCYYDLDGDGYAEPWIVTQIEQGAELARVVAGFDPLDIVHDGKQIIRIPRVEYFTAFYFLPDPEGGFYGIGYGSMLRSFGDVIDTSFNQMLDAGNLQNAGGGWIGDGLDFQSESEEFRFEPGRYYTVNTDGKDIRQQIVNMEFPGPSPVLMNLLTMMMDTAKQMTSVQDILTGAASAQTMQPTTLMALIDQGLKAFTAVYKRIYDSLSAEFSMMYALNRRYLDDHVYQAYLGAPATVQEDFADDGCLVMPVADPNSVTMAQRMARAAFLQRILEDPVLGKLLDPQDILHRILSAGDVEDIPSALAKPQPPGPGDALAMRKAIAEITLTENQAAHQGALAVTEGARQSKLATDTASKIMEHQPDFYKNPPAGNS